MRESNLTADDIKKLSAPFSEKVIGVKIQSQSKAKDKAMLVLYVQHTDVYSRLEEVDPAWSVELVDEQMRGDYISVRAKLTVKGVTRENSGEGNDPKSAASDAIKRAAMLFGVGRYLYDSEQVWVPYNEQTDRYRTFTMEDFTKALRHGQAKTPTAESEAAKTAAPGGPVVPTATRSATGRTVISPRAGVATAIRTRASVGAEIAAVAEKMGLKDSELRAWGKEVTGLEAQQMDLAALEKFLGVLQAESGRMGIV